MHQIQLSQFFKFIETPRPITTPARPQNNHTIIKHTEPTMPFCSILGPGITHDEYILHSFVNFFSRPTSFYVPIAAASSLQITQSGRRPFLNITFPVEGASHRQPKATTVLLFFCLNGTDRIMIDRRHRYRQPNQSPSVHRFTFVLSRPSIPAI